MLAPFWYMLVYSAVMLFGICVYCSCRSRQRRRDNDHLTAPPRVAPDNNSIHELSEEACRKFIRDILITKTITDSNNISGTVHNTTIGTLTSRTESSSGSTSDTQEQQHDPSNMDEDDNVVVVKIDNMSEISSSSDEESSNAENNKAKAVVSIVGNVEEQQQQVVIDLAGDCCEICLSEYKVHDVVASSRNPTCPHVFHKDCLVEWLLNLTKQPNKQMTCPCCRQDYIVA